MRDPNRIARVLSLLETEWRNNPDQRLGQLVHNVFSRQRPDRNWVQADEISDLRLMEDDVWERLLNKTQERKQ